jgi:hypothetical protein
MLRATSALFAGTMLTSLSFADTIEIPISKDARIMQAHKPNNAGAEPALWIKSGNGADRIVTEFDISALNNVPLDSILSARVQFVTDYTRQRRRHFTRDGFDIEIRRIDTDFEEGNGVWDRYVVKLEFPKPRGLQVMPLHATGLATTFACPTDLLADNSKPECPLEWNGALDMASDAVSQPITVYNNMPVVDGLQYVSFDVSDDFIDQLSNGNEKARYLVKKRYEGSVGNDNAISRGRMYFFSKEGAVYYGDTRKTPKLIVETEN